MNEHPMKFRAIGLTDDVTTCECCGKQNLKRTVMMLQLDADGNGIDVFYFGTTCAERNTRKSKSRIEREIIEEKNRREQEEEAERCRQRWAQEMVPVYDFLHETYGWSKEEADSIWNERWYDGAVHGDSERFYRRRHAYRDAVYAITGHYFLI